MARILWRPPSDPSSARSSTAAFCELIALRTFSNPATAIPALRARPITSQQRCANKTSTRSASPGGVVTAWRATRAKSLRLTAVSTISRRGQSHKPRPGRREVTSGHSSPPGPTTKRSRLDRSWISPVAMQRRSEPPSCIPESCRTALLLWRALVTPTPAATRQMARFRPHTNGPGLA